eukprot:COSAG01_NODE_64_length_29509_cov_1035.985209_18_plen_76_part_00
MAGIPDLPLPSRPRALSMLLPADVQVRAKAKEAKAAAKAAAREAQDSAVLRCVMPPYLRYVHRRGARGQSSRASD